LKGSALNSVIIFLQGKKLQEDHTQQQQEVNTMRSMHSVHGVHC
jgi:hypothetical protein